jgi:hypothetical protein
MLSGIEARGQAAGERRVAAVVARVAGELGAVPGVMVTIEGDAVVIAGRGLGRRAWDEPALRWPGGAR